MPYYYHVHRGPEKAGIEKDYKKGYRTFFARKDTFWNKVEKKIGLEGYGGYREYRLSIPKSDLTSSLQSSSKNKILLLNIKNKLHRKLIKKYSVYDEDDKGWFFDRCTFLEFLQKNKYNGVDFHYINTYINDIEDEMIIFDLTKYIDAGKLELVYMVFNGYDNPIEIKRK
jgi:hypothetical protein